MFTCVCVCLLTMESNSVLIFSVHFCSKNRCVNMIAKLFNAPSADQTKQAVGVGTVGSSEAMMLAGLAFKKKWQNKRKAQKKPFDKPNIVTGANVQVGIYMP